MSSAVTTTSGGMVVVTQVFPSNQPQPQGVQQVGPRTQRFIQAYPLAVGAVQIIIGILVLCGIFLTFGAASIEVFSGFFVWGAGFYITSGVLTVAAGKSLSRRLINTALGFNIVSSFAAAIAIVLYSIGLLFLSVFIWAYDSQISASPVVMLVFHILEFAVSLTVSVFACRATCDCCDKQQHPYVHFTPAQAPPDAVPATMAKPTEDQDQIPHGLDEPPAYTG